MNVGSLFAGIGGFDLGLERAGMRTVWQVEINPFRRAILAQHFPDAKRFEDVREVGAPELAPVDLICGGFPCQDISIAGMARGITGARSGLWADFARVVGELRPRYVLVENVPALTRNEWLGTVLADLAESGYDAEWDCLPASAFGAPHIRSRIWLVAYPTGSGNRAEVLGREAVGAYSARPPSGPSRSDWWAPEPDVGRVADGVPARVDRLRALGDALVPQIAEWIGRRILEWERVAA